MGAENLADHPSLMEAFVLRKTRDYQEPQRRGTPRGRPKAFSPPKFTAAVYCLRNTPLKEIASAVPVSYGLLRKWRTEERFLSLLSALSKEFVDQVVLRHLRKRAEVQCRLDKAYGDGSIAEIATTPPPRLGWRDFEDLPLYSPDVLGLLAERLWEIHTGIMRGSRPGNDRTLTREASSERYVALQVEGLYELVGEHLRPLKEGPQKRERLFPSYGQAQREAEYEASLTALVEGPMAQEGRKRMILVLHRLMGRFSSVELGYLGVQAKKKERPAGDESARKAIGRHLL